MFESMLCGGTGCTLYEYLVILLWAYYVLPGKNAPPLE